MFFAAKISQTTAIKEEFGEKITVTLPMMLLNWTHACF